MQLIPEACLCQPLQEGRLLGCTRILVQTRLFVLVVVMRLKKNTYYVTI